MDLGQYPCFVTPMLAGDVVKDAVFRACSCIVKADGNGRHNKIEYMRQIGNGTTTLRLHPLPRCRCGGDQCGWVWRAGGRLSIVAARGEAKGKKFKEIVTKRMAPAQIAEGQKLSRELWEKYVVPFQKKTPAQKLANPISLFAEF